MGDSAYKIPNQEGIHCAWKMKSAVICPQSPLLQYPARDYEQGVEQTGICLKNEGRF